MRLRLLTVLSTATSSRAVLSVLTSLPLALPVVTVVASAAVVVVERSSRSPEPAWPGGLARFAEKKYGETRLWFAEPFVPDAVDAEVLEAEGADADGNSQ